MKKQWITLAALTASVVLASNIRSANAALEITLATPGSTTVTVLDNGVGDNNPAVGQIGFDGSIGQFSTVITAGTSNSPGANGLAILQTHTIAVSNSSATAATLTFTMGDTGFTTPSGAGLSLGSSFAGTFLSPTPGAVVTFQSFASPTNVQFGTTVTSGLHSATQLVGSFAPMSFTTADRNATFTSAGAYSLTDVTNISLAQNAQANVSGTTSVVAGGGASTPEPASLGILGAGLAGLLGLRRRRVA